MRQIGFAVGRRRVVRGNLLKLVILVSIFTAGQAHSGAHMVYVTESTASGVELIGPLQQGRYVVFSDHVVSQRESSLGVPISMTAYAVDCKVQGIAVVAISLNKNFGKSRQPEWTQLRAANVPSSFDPATLEYDELESFIHKSENALTASDHALMPKLKPLVVTVSAACQMGAEPAQAEQIAKRMRETGGLADMKELSCEFGRSEGQRFRWIVRFSDAAGAVQVNGRWLVEGSSVEPRKISFYLPSIDLRGTVDRVTGEWSSHFTGSSPYSGTCDLARNTPPKF